ncbi:prepilin-type N-terminal cleavage/methylation domain-containing protein [bacterium]|nr:prepilin-type N-terminal cleavage/methylation domain-containing protein [bacterium]
MKNKNNYQLPRLPNIGGQAFTVYRLRKGGFSFIELMTVVAIMAVLVAVSMPMFRNYTRGRNLKEGTNMIISALRRTRNTTITERKRYRTVFDALNHAVAIYKEDDIVNPAENWKALPEFVEFDTNLFADEKNYTTTPDIYYLEFESAGGLSSEHDVTPPYKDIGIVETSTQDTNIIKVNKLTGRINVE